jgi:hypothetical protein
MSTTDTSRASTAKTLSPIEERVFDVQWTAGSLLGGGLPSNRLLTARATVQALCRTDKVPFVV